MTRPSRQNSRTHGRPSARLVLVLRGGSAGGAQALLFATQLPNRDTCSLRLLTKLRLLRAQLGSSLRGLAQGGSNIGRGALDCI
jgi:hypothetical protein